VDKIVGIDLGTSTSCLAVIIDGKPVVIPDSRGNPVTPSYIHVMDDGKILVGPQAKMEVISDPYSTIWATKRLIGRKYDDDEVQEAKKHYGYDILADEDGGVKVRGRDKELTPTEVGAIILKYLTRIGKKAIGEDIKRAVITVPAFFTDPQRKATRDAGALIGLDVVRLVNEPTAAALAYGYDREDEQTIAIYDLGGGTFDLSILAIGGGVYEVIATDGDSYLGGEDFDNRLVDYLVQDFKKNFDINIYNDKMAHQRVKDASERAKIALSKNNEVEINLPAICPDLNKWAGIEKAVTRDQYEEMVEDMVDKTIDVFKGLLDEMNMGPEDIDNLIMVGGMTRMPLVLKKVAEFYGRELDTGMDPDESVAKGAAIHAASLSGEKLVRRKKPAPPKMDETMPGIPAPPDATMPGLPPEGMTESDMTMPGTSPESIAASPPSTDAPEEKILPMEEEESAPPSSEEDMPPMDKKDADIAAGEEWTPSEKQNKTTKEKPLPPGLDEFFVPPGSERDAQDKPKKVAETKQPEEKEIPDTEDDEQPIALMDAQEEDDEIVEDTSLPVDVDDIPEQPEPEESAAVETASETEKDEEKPQAPPVFIPKSEKPDKHGDRMVPAPEDREDKIDERPVSAGPIIREEGLDYLDKTSVEQELKPQIDDEDEDMVQAPVLLDVLSQAVGIAHFGGHSVHIIKRFAKLPAKATQIFTTCTDNQERIRIQVMQGESKYAEENTSLGEFVLDGIERAKRGQAEIEVIFDIDQSGLFMVSAKDKITGAAKEISLTDWSGGMTEDEAKEAGQAVGSE
jgi:molecular chaperone DnaK (HSP70)